MPPPMIIGCGTWCQPPCLHHISQDQARTCPERQRWCGPDRGCLPQDSRDVKTNGLISWRGSRWTRMSPTETRASVVMWPIVNPV